MTVKEIYDTYAKHCLPKDACENQKEGTEQAFYAGCMSMIKVLINIAEFPEEQSVEILIALSEECNEFRRRKIQEHKQKIQKHFSN